ncbi:MAG: rRNA adenine dimethyltransferase family protein, partial [Actinomycetota bacterium]
GANKLISNLPYNVATPLVIKVLTEAPEIIEATVMVQKEVARRMTAPPSDDDYGPLAITIDAYAEARILFSVSPRSFLPPPEVESAVVVIKRRPQPLYGGDTTAFLLFVRELFTLRRKTVRSALKTRRPAMTSRVAETVIAEAGLTSESRVEKLTPAELFNVFAAQKRFLS